MEKEYTVKDFVSAYAHKESEGQPVFDTAEEIARSSFGNADYLLIGLVTILTAVILFFIFALIKYLKK